MGEGLEIKTTFDLRLSNINDKMERASSLTIAGADYTKKTQGIPTSEEALAIGDVAVGGWMWVRNLDTTNYVELLSATGLQAFAKMSPGDPPVMFRTAAGATYFAIADTGACVIEFGIVDA